MAAPASSSSPRSRAGQIDRRIVIGSAVALAIAVLGGATLIALGTDDEPRLDPQEEVTQGTTPTGAPCLLAPDDQPSAVVVDEDCEPSALAGGRPSIIDRPNSGVAPENPGDRGGWEQLALLGLLLVAVAGIGFAIFRGGRRAQAGRQAWAAAAATGRDGAASTVPAAGSAPGRPRSGAAPGEGQAGGADPDRAEASATEEARS